MPPPPSETRNGERVMIIANAHCNDERTFRLQVQTAGLADQSTETLALLARFAEAVFEQSQLLSAVAAYGMGWGLCDINSSKRLSVRKVANSESVYTFLMFL